MKSIESAAKTIEDAIRQGLEKLDVSLGDVKIDIIQEGTKGLFGIMGSKDAKVRLTVKDDDQDDDILSAFSTEKKAEAPRKEQKPKPRQRKKAEKPQKTEASEKPSKTPAPKQPKKAPSKEVKKTAEPFQDYPLSNPDTAAGKAQHFIKDVTKLMKLEVAVEAATDDDGNVKINIHGDTLGILIGRRGETLDALQYLTSLNVNHGQDDYTRVTLDTENYRAKREEALKRLANRMAKPCGKNRPQSGNGAHEPLRAQDTAQRASAKRLGHHPQ